MEAASSHPPEDSDRCLAARTGNNQNFTREQEKVLATIRERVTAVKHELNNPLTIISGNAQLLLELVRVFDLGDEFVKPIRDIEEASLRITASFNRLGYLKDLMN